jgi:hypothetical protein
MGPKLHFEAAGVLGAPVGFVEKVRIGEQWPASCKLPAWQDKPGGAGCCGVKQAEAKPGPANIIENNSTRSQPRIKT